VRIVVYTSIIGSIDRLWSVLPGSGDVSHIAFVDSEKTEVGMWTGDPPHILRGSKDLPAIPPTWKQHIVGRHRNERRTARMVKVLPHRFLPDADVWAWVDGNVRLRRHPREIVEDYMDSDLVTLRHPERGCTYAEAAFCVKIKKDKRDILDAQAARYRGAGLPAHWGLAETRVVIRRNTDAIRELNEAWWAEIERGSVRDQVALPFVCWQAGTRWGELPGSCRSGNKSKDWYYVRHKV